MTEIEAQGILHEAVKDRVFEAVARAAGNSESPVAFLQGIGITAVRDVPYVINHAKSI